jgi:hypothetical protein
MNRKEDKKFEVLVAELSEEMLNELMTLLKDGKHKEFVEYLDKIVGNKAGENDG